MSSASKKFVYTIQAQYKGDGELNKLKTGLQAIGNIKSFERLNKNISGTAKELDKAEAEAKKLNAALDGSHTAKMANEAQKADRAVAGLTKRLDREQEKLSGLSDSLRQSGINTAQLATEQKKLQKSMQSRGGVVAARNALDIRSTREIKSEIIALSRAYKTLENSGKASMAELAVAKERLRAKTKKLHKELGRGPGLFSKSAKGMRSLHGVALSLSTLFAGFSATMFAKAIFDAGVSSQSLVMAFEAIYGSGERAREELEFVKAASEELGLVFESTAKSYKGISAASKGTILEGNKTRKIFLAVSSAATALGLSSDDTSGALNAISQMMSKGKVQAEELRQQLGERLPGAFNLMAEAIGVSTEELNDMLEAGEVGIDVLEKFADVLQDKYGKSALEMETAQKAVNRMANAWFDLRVEIANSGFLDKATEGMEALTTALKDPQVQQAAKDLANTIFALGEGVFKFGFFAKATFEVVASGILSLVQYGAGMISMFALLTDTLGITKGAFEELQAISEAAEGAAIELADKSMQSWDIMKKGVSGYAKETKKTGSVVEDTFKNIEKSAEDAAAVQTQVTKESLKEMKREYKGLLKEVSAIQKKIRDLNGGIEKGAGGSAIGSLAAELREMSRSNMTDLQVWKDKRKEADEYFVAAQKARKEANRLSAAGDYSGAKILFEQAAEYADSAKDLYKDLNEEVKKNDKVVISSARAQKIAMAETAATGKLQIEVLRDQEKAAQAAADALDQKASGKLSGKEIIEGEITATKNLQDEVGKVGTKWQKVWKENKTQGDGVLDGYEAKIKQLDGTVITLYMQEVTKKRWGGMVGNLAMVNALRMATGGKLAGYGGGDRIRALLEAGEFVVRKEAVAKYGPGFLHALNSMQLDMGAQVQARIGGYISSVAAPVLMQSGGQVAAPQSMGHYTVDITNRNTGTTIPVMTSSRQNAEALIRELQNMGASAA